jgi:predicted nucleotidyltransferase
MRPSEVFEQNRELIREIASRYRVVNPRVFGSVLHGDDGDDSDIDIVVDTVKGTTLFDLIELEQELHAKLGVSVHIAIGDALHSLVRDRILAEARPV